MSHRPLTIPESLRSMTPLSWLKEKKKKIYYFHCTATDIPITAESRKSLMKKLTLLIL